MRAMTIVVKFDADSKPEPVAFGDKLLGGEVTALAAYDVIHTMEIAEEALENSNDDRCIEAAETIERIVVGSITNG